MPDIRLLRVDQDGRAEFSAVNEGVLQVSSLAHLVQTVINHLLTTPGSDRLSPNRGAGLSDLCRQYRTNSKELQEKIAERIEKVDKQIRDEQGQLNLRPSERLDSLTLLSAAPDPDNPARLNIVVGIQSEADEQAEIVI
jgi:hypothetical protein